MLDRKAVIAAYASDRETLAQFKRKVEGDFKKYQLHWVPEYPNWQVVYNGEPTADRVRFVHELKADADLVTIRHLLRIIEELIWPDRRRIAEYLGVDAQYIQHDTLETILDDLISHGDTLQEFGPWPAPMYIGDKIVLNYRSEEIETAKSQYTESAMYFRSLHDLLSNYADSQISTLKSRVIGDYQGFSGSFSERLTRLVESYSRRYNNDDTYVFYARVVLLYLFEHCVIGSKTVGEARCSAPQPESNLSLNTLVLAADVLGMLKGKKSYVVIEDVMEKFLSVNSKRTPDSFIDALTFLFTVELIEIRGYKIKVVARDAYTQPSLL